MKFILSTLIVILLNQTVSAQTASDLVQRDVMKEIRKFSRETRLYHYFQMPTITDRNGNKTIDSWFLKDQGRTEWINRLVSSSAGTFWNLNDHNTIKVNAGPGLYFALDPNSSREYGDTMLLLDVPAGSKYISTVNSIALKPDTLAALVRENIVSPNQLKVTSNTLGLENGLTMDSLKNMVLPENRDFRILLQNVFQNVEIKFIEYGYKSHQNGFCKGGRLTAIIFIGSKPSDQTSKNVLAIVDPEFRKQYLAADYLVGFFNGALNTLIDLTMRYRSAISEIRSTAFDAPKVVNWPKALAIIGKYLNSDEVAHLRDISFECKTP